MMSTAILIFLVVLSYTEVAYTAECVEREIKKCIEPASKHMSENGFDITSRTYSADCKHVTDAMDCLVGLGCKRPRDDATDETSVKAALTFDVAEDFCSETNKKFIMDNQKCLTTSKVNEAIDKCDDNMPEGLPSCNDLRVDLKCRHDTFSSCNVGAANALTSFTSKLLNNQLRKNKVICKLEDIKPVAVVLCKKVDLHPCDTALEEFSHGYTAPKPGEGLPEINSAKVEAQCGNLTVVRECLKKLPCSFNNHDDETASYASKMKVFGIVCLDNNKQILLNKDVQNCMNSQTFKNSTIKCDANFTESYASAKPNPALECIAANNMMRCHYRAAATCSKGFGRLMLQIKHTIVDIKLYNQKQPACELDRDLKRAESGGISGPALSYFMIFFALLTALIFPANN